MGTPPKEQRQSLVGAGAVKYMLLQSVVPYLATDVWMEES